MRRLKLIAVIALVVVAAAALMYVDYTIYKAKYPDTAFWMWLLDSKK